MDSALAITWGVVFVKALLSQDESGNRVVTWAIRLFLGSLLSCPFGQSVCLPALAEVC